MTWSALKVQRRLIDQHNQARYLPLHHQEKFELAQCRASNAVNRLLVPRATLGRAERAAVDRQVRDLKATLGASFGAYFGWRIVMPWLLPRKLSRGTTMLMPKAAPWLRISSPRGARLLVATRMLYDLIGTFLPPQVANEEFGDALEALSLRLRRGDSRLLCAYKAATTVLWALLNTARRFVAGLRSWKAS